MKQVNIGIIGIGTIGGGVVDAICQNGELIAKRTGVSVKIKRVCDTDKKALAGLPDGACNVKTSSFEDILNDKEIDIVVELIGGVSPARELILGAMKNKKHVVTANKALLSEHWSEILKAAADNNVSINFEASVGGGIPVIRALRDSFVGDNIDTIFGILNGTTNFILTEMSQKGCSFEEALKVAQDNGIAESDPTLDISGADSAHKLAILSILGFGIEVSPDDIYAEGIDKLTAQDIEKAREWGYSIKLLAIAKNAPAGVQLRVHPTLLSSSHLLSDVRGADNAIFIKGDLVGESLLFGKGAGRKPTASSVVSDIVDIAKQVAFIGKENPFPYNPVYSGKGKNFQKIEDLKVSCYLRFSVLDKPGVLASISSILSDNDISIASVLQEERKEGETVPLIIFTHECLEGSMRKAIGKINKQDYIADETVMIRIEE